MPTCLVPWKQVQTGVYIRAFRIGKDGKERALLYVGSSTGTNDLYGRTQQTETRPRTSTYDDIERTIGIKKLMKDRYRIASLSPVRFQSSERRLAPYP